VIWRHAAKFLHDVFVTGDQMPLVSRLRLRWITDQLYCMFLYVFCDDAVIYTQIRVMS